MIQPIGVRRAQFPGQRDSQIERLWLWNGVRFVRLREEPTMYQPSSSATPDLFYKGRSQEKTHLLRLQVFLLLSPLERARSVLIYPCHVLAEHCAPVVWVFSTSGFHRFLATKPVSSETNKAERGQIWRP
jgi:hypothetical protein